MSFAYYERTTICIKTIVREYSLNIFAFFRVVAKFLLVLVRSLSIASQLRKALLRSPISILWNCRKALPFFQISLR